MREEGGEGVKKKPKRKFKWVKWNPKSKRKVKYAGEIQLPFILTPQAIYSVEADVHGPTKREREARCSEVKT